MTSTVLLSSWVSLLVQLWELSGFLPLTKMYTMYNVVSLKGFFQQFWEKARGQNREKMMDFTSKLGEINDIEHNKGSKT